MSFINKFVGDKKFYKKVLYVAIPIMIQNGITNFVSLLDNIMVGQLGTEEMSGVAIVNQLMFVYNLCIFGGVSGAGIFTAQYYGRKDDEGVRNTFRFKLLMGMLLTLMATMVLVFFGSALVQSYLKGEADAGNPEKILMYAMRYLKIMLIGLPAFMVLQCYASTLRECGKTFLPMFAGVTAILINLAFNYLLIFGKFGFPKMGVEGAAVATVLSRYIEVLIVVIWTHMHKNEYTYIRGLYRTMRIPKDMTIAIIKKGMPLLMNETLWAIGTAALVQCYSVRSLSVVPAINICNTINNVFNIVFIALGDAVAIIVGQLLGAGKMKEAKETDTKLIAFSVTCCTVIAAVMMATANVFPNAFNTDVSTRQLAAQFIMTSALFMPQHAFLHATYFTLRSGGKTIVTFFFDSVYICGISVPCAFLLSSYTGLNIVLVYALVQMADWLKCLIGFILVKKGVWLNNIVEK